MRSSRSTFQWLLLGIFALEFLLFDQFGAKRYTAIYPRWNDQIQYLGEAYTGHEYARAHGLPAALWQTLVNGSAQGTLHDFAATLLFAVTGPSRSAALALNMLALIGWQGALFLAVRKRMARAGAPAPPATDAPAFAAALLPLALAGPWRDIPGSAYDFRLDHLAMCGLGIASAAALATDGFRSRAGAAVFGAAVGVTLLTRFLTGTYFAVIFVALAGWALATPDRGRRLGNLGLAAIVAFLVAAPLFWLNREWIWNYYYIGHFIGPESAIRNQQFGLGRSLAFVWGQFAGLHLGMFFLVVAGVSVAGWLVAARRRDDSATLPPLRDPWALGTIFLFAPALVLTLHQQKSEVVVSALSPGAVLLVIAAWQRIALALADARKRLPAAPVVVAVAILAFFVRCQLTPGPSPEFLADNGKVIALADYLFERAVLARIEHPAVAVDYITDCLDAQVVRVICYERKKQWVPFEMTLPNGIAAPDAADVFARLDLSDFVFVTEQAPPGRYPFDHALETLRPRIRAWCDEHRDGVSRVSVFGRTMALYQRKNIPRP